MSIDIQAVPQARAKGDKILGQCPACAENGGDKKSEHLLVNADGSYGCAAFQGDREHRRRIWQLIGSRDQRQMLPWAAPRQYKPTPRVDLLPRIKRDYPAGIAELWESSPIRCDENLDEPRAFLSLFPADDTLWIGTDIYQTGKPEHAANFRTRAEWQKETLTAPGTRIGCSAFKPGSYSRSGTNVERHAFVVVETDDLGDGKKYADRGEFCSLIRWLREGCYWQLAAVVDSGGKSLHAWFHHPGLPDVTQLSEHSEALGLDAKFSEPAQPWRLPGVMRENGERRQQLVYLDLEGKK